MFQRWIKKLQLATEPGAAPDNPSLERLTALLLVEVARSDSDVDEAELAAIARAIQGSSPSIEAEEITDIIATARADADLTISFHEHIRQINKEFDRAQKLLLIEQMWRVAYADGDLDKYEEYTIRKMCDLLFVEHQEFIKAKLRILDEPQ